MGFGFRLIGLRVSMFTCALFWPARFSSALPFVQLGGIWAGPNRDAQVTRLESMSPWRAAETASGRLETSRERAGGRLVEVPPL